ncbi:LCP family protein [Streptomyces sp. NPDC048442]|uniref:LCP family protein n=1 Tax=Streptomyces sp. NPDC048442 TaxID=3154823 RepID=UPI00343A5C2E
MGSSSVHGEGTRARNLGWDESLYEDAAPGSAAQDAPDTPDAPAAGSGDSGSSASGSGSSGSGRRRGGSRRRQPEGGRGGKGGSKGKRVLRWGAISLAVLILGTAGAGYLYYEYLNSKLQKEKLSLGDSRPDKAAPNAAGQTPLNILLIGSDARDNPENKSLGGAKNSFDSPPLADVQMLLHMSADRSNISVVSMPRDTLLKLPKCTDPKTGKVHAETVNRRKANESLGRGGPGCTVSTWESLTNIHIDHFMMIDFGGVVSMADAIGGVPVCVQQNVYSRDRKGKGSGLKLPKGTTPVKGEQALQWLRTRYGFEDGTDIGRTKAQHMYMNSMVRELRANAKLTDPNKLRKLAEAAIEALKVDDTINSVGELFDLGTQLKSVPTNRITMSTMPWRYTPTKDVEPMPGDAEQLFRLVREDLPLDGKAAKKPAKKDPEPDKPAQAPGEIGVTVLNRTGDNTQPAVPRRASAIAEVLTGKGFTRASSAKDPVSTAGATVVNYPSADMEGDARAVAKALGLPSGAVKKSTDASGVTVIVGADWRTGSTYPKPKDDKTPSTASILNGEDDKACMKIQPGYTW